MCVEYTASLFVLCLQTQESLAIQSLKLTNQLKYFLYSFCKAHILSCQNLHIRTPILELHPDKESPCFQARSSGKHRRPLTGSGSQQTSQLFSLAIHLAGLESFISASAVGWKCGRTALFMLSLILQPQQLQRMFSKTHSNFRLQDICNSVYESKNIQDSKVRMKSFLLP